jgi:hypothetical protein
MEQLELMLEGRKITLTPAAQRGEGEVWVPLEAFCDATGAVLKDIDGSGQLAVCDDGGDVCILLRDGDIHDVSGTPFGRLDAFAEPLQLSWSVTDDGVLAVLRQTSKSNTGLAVGDRPPKIELPDVVTGELISADVYYDKPAVFYMWASW